MVVFGGDRGGQEGEQERKTNEKPSELWDDGREMSLKRNEMMINSWRYKMKSLALGLDLAKVVGPFKTWFLAYRET